MVSYYIPIKVPLSKILSQSSINRIFQNIHQLHETHIELHAMLQKIGEQKFERRIISKPFKAYKDRFAMYAQYLLGLGRVLDNTICIFALIQTFIIKWILKNIHLPPYDQRMQRLKLKTYAVLTRRRHRCYMMAVKKSSFISN